MLLFVTDLFVTGPWQLCDVWMMMIYVLVWSDSRLILEILLENIVHVALDMFIYFSLIFDNLIRKSRKREGIWVFELLWLLIDVSV